jgi:ABC-type dipeptide/oligopeptide/nickel transport system permease component
MHGAAQMNAMRFVAGRILAAIPLLAGVLICTFVIVRLLPGDPVAFLASGPNVSPADIARIRHEYGLDRGIFEQLLIFLRDVAQGNLGRSMLSGQPVLSDLLDRLPASLELTLVGMLLAVTIAVPLGVLSAARPDSIIDHLARVFAVVGSSFPPFVTAIVLIFVFYYLLPWAPDPMGRIDILEGPPPHLTGLYLIDSLVAGDGAKFISAAKQLILPAITIAVLVISPIMRITRGAMISALESDYVRTAKSAGLSSWHVYTRYALYNALTPVITTIGLVFSYILGASVLVEKVFSWPGVAAYTLQAMSMSDYAPVQGFVLLIGFTYIIISLIVDFICHAIDPRLGT